MSKFKIALCQLSVTSDKERNIAHAREAIEHAAQNGSKLVVLPLHLFDVDIPGDITFKESGTLTAGDEATIVDTDVGQIGIGICHYIRFPEFAMLYPARGAHLLCYPGAFNMSTGQLLWELMQRARAVDNQFGEIISSTGHEEATIFAEIDYSLIQIRRWWQVVAWGLSSA